jgi:hypothetical protein
LDGRQAVIATLVALLVIAAAAMLMLAIGGLLA